MTKDRKLPLVSVPVVTYNQRDFLRECLESILAQDYGNLQVIVSDDGSQDGTRELAQEYQKRFPELVVPLLSSVNRGVTANQEAALRACTGEYISWMAGDDLMLPGKVSTQVRYMEEHPNCAVCYHDLEIFDSDLGITLGKFSETDKPRSGDIATLVRYGSFNGAVSNMVRASASPRQGFEKTIGTASDWLYFVECLAQGGTIDYIDQVLARHRRHKNNVTKPDKHNPQMDLLRDHVLSACLILTKYPHLAKHVNYRLAYLMTYPRLRDGGEYYNAYLWASLGYRLSLRPAVAIAANTLFGFRK